MQKPDVTPEAAAEELLRRRKARESLAEYINYVSGKNPPRHMRFLCKKLEDLSSRSIDRLLVAEPPGHGKSFVVSWHYPAYYLSKFPDHNIVAVSHTDSFAETWGRRVRNLIMSDEHRRLFPNVTISEDSRAAGRWDLSTGGSYYATGVGGAVTGKRANCILLDDVFRGIEDADSAVVRDAIWNWYGADLYSRLVPGGIIGFINTRFNVDDLAGRLLAAAQRKDGDKWTTVILPAIAKENDQLGRKPGEALWPEWMDVPALNRIKNQPAMTPRLWSALYLQDPVVDGGNIIKRSWFRIWNEKDPPKCKLIIQSWDTASSKKDSAAYSACTTWGVFEEKDTGLPSLILLSAFRKRMNYPELRKMAKRLAYDYKDDNFDFPADQKFKREPDIILIEDQSSGSDLIPDLRRAGVAAIPIKPRMYGDKNARVGLSSDVLENGRVWVPGQPPNYTAARRWAEEFIISVISFPAANSRDWVDSMSQAIIRVKKSGWIKNSEDPVEPEYTRIGRQAVRSPLYG